MKSTASMRKLISVAAAVVLACGLMPASAFAAHSGSVQANDAAAYVQRSEAEIDAAVGEMLGAGDYIEGEAIVCYLGSRSAGAGGFSTQADTGDGLLAGAEELSTVTARQYAEATGETVPAAPAASGMFTTQASEAEPVAVALVHEDGMSTEDLLRALLHDERVLSAEPNYLMSFEDDGDDGDGAMASPASANTSLSLTAGGLAPQADGETTYNMTRYQWFSTGATGATPQYLAGVANPGIQVPDWNNPAKTNASGVIAIMDSGVDYTHPDLKNVMYHFSPAQQAQLGCGEFGYAPSRDDKTDPIDTYGHGTHCAGIAAAQWNGFGVSGVANGAQICAVSIARSMTDSSFSYDGIVRGYDFLIRAAKAGVDIRSVNRSLGCGPTNNADVAMIQAAGEAGIVTCIASGNSNTDIDKTFDDVTVGQQSPYLLVVNASRQQDDRSWFSCYGNYTTDVFSPGSGILSTIPLSQDSDWRYFPQADDARLYMETAFETLPHVYTGTSSFDEETGKIVTTYTELAVSKANIGVDGDYASAKVTVTLPMGESSSLYVDVPVGSITDDQIQDASLSFYPIGIEPRGVGLSVMLEDGTYAREGGEINLNRSDNVLYGWALAGLHITDMSKLGQKIARFEKDGKTYIRLRFSAMLSDLETVDHTPKTFDMYIDQIALGGKNNGAYLPYCYMNGTSMATPAVTGSVAVVSSRTLATNPAARATEAVRILKGAMHQTDGYKGLCKQNGQINLGILGQTGKYAPVLETAKVEGTTITLTGAYFGSETGALTVGGVAAQPSSWSPTEITAPWPSGAASGLVPITVTTGVAEAGRAFMLSAPESDPLSAAVYERDLTVPNLHPDNLNITACPASLTATEDGILFAAVADNKDREDASTRYLVRSDDKGASWTSIQLPQDLKLISLAAGDGALYVMGATPADNPVSIEYWHLYRMDIAKGTFELLRSYDNYNGHEINRTGAIAYAAGHLYFVDFYADPDASDPEPFHMRFRCFDADYVPGDSVILKFEYSQSGPYDGPKVAVAGNTIYALGIDKVDGSKDAKHICGLERVDVADDGTLTNENLSAALSDAKDGIADDTVCIAAGAHGLYLIGRDLGRLLPEGAPYTDTFFLAKGAKTFAPYERTLSLSPLYQPTATCSDGWLYAFAISSFEELPVFGRATLAHADHEWGEPVYTWADDNSTATATRTCAICGEVESETVKTTSAVTKEPTADEPGTRTYTAPFASSWAQTQTKDVEIPKLDPGPEKATYSVVSGDGATWTKGGTSALSFTVKRSADDGETYGRFTGIAVDGKDVDASSYTAEAGSLVLALKPSYLETLDVGTHELVFNFDDGAASAKFSVKAAAGKTSGSPKTGDPLAPWTAPMLAVVAAAALGIALALRKRA